MITRSNVLLLCLLFSLILHDQVESRQERPFQVQSVQKSDVFIEGFYWNSTPGGIWWDSLAHLAPSLAASGFGAIWFPPPTKGAAGALSMGYDIYDQYDFGDYNQKGSLATRFGTRAALVNAINAYHTNGMQVFADAVMGHMDGGDQYTRYDCIPTSAPFLPSDSSWLIFNYPNGSGRFKKTAKDFYPNQLTCDIQQPYHGPDPAYRFGEYLAHAQSDVGDSLTVWGKYLRQVLGFDGFRIDEAKGIDPIFMGPWLQQADSNGYAVAEDYDGQGGIQNLLYWIQHFGGNCSMFDFPLRFTLQAMCNTTSGLWDMQQLDGAGLVNNGTSGYNVATFAENHDFDRTGWDGSVDIGQNPILYDKDMAYAYIIFSEGRPCVWFRDYYIYGLKGKIDTLIWIRQNYLGGSTTKRSGLNAYYIRQDGNTDQSGLAQNIYVARRDGFGSQPGGYLVLNANAQQWLDVWVDTELPIGSVYRDFTGKDADKTVVGPAPGGSKNRVKLWCPPRSYTIYVADTTHHITHPPYINHIANLNAYTNTLFQYQTVAGDADPVSLTYSLSGNPFWLSISSSGLISGTPGINDLSPSTVTVNVVSPSGDTASSTFTLSVISHPLMDGTFEGTGIWGQPIGVADTLTGWAGAKAENLSVTLDSTYVYLGAHVRAIGWMSWAFLINTKGGGGSTDSWLRSIQYNHSNLPDYVFRGTFGSYAEFHTWNGSSWSGVGTPLPSSEFAETITPDSIQEGWVEARIPRSSIGNPSVIDVQFFITGDQNSEATFDACPNDQNTTALTGITTHLHYYAERGARTLTQWNLQFPGSTALVRGNDVTVYARTFGLGITDSAGAGTGIHSWIGYATVNTNPSTWSTWIPATYNVDVNSYDEYKSTFGSQLSQGVYYYASRFQYDTGSFLYGGYSSTSGGLWDSVHNVSGVMTVYDVPGVPSLVSPANDGLHQPRVVQLTWLPVGFAQSYRVQVAFDSNFIFLVLNDSTVTGSSRTVGPLLNDTIYYWRVRSKNIAGTGTYSAIWTFQVEQITQSYPMLQSWNMVSLPMNVYDGRKSILFPEAISKAFAYDPSSGYVIRDTLLTGMGYWMKFAVAETTALSGFPLLSDTISVQQGWNMIGSITSSIAASSIIQIPPNNIVGRIFGYAGAYQPVSIIDPAKSYWVKCNASGTLILTSGANVKPENHLSPNDATPAFSTLTIVDASKRSQILYLRETDRDMKNSAEYELPPVPPEGSFDVRFGSQSVSESVGKKESKDVDLQLTGVHFPLTLTFHSLGPKLTLREHSVVLDDKSYTIRDSVGTVRLHLSGSMSVPKSFALEQNYPNPFNPSTTIRYSLPEESHVQLTIYNLLGQKVATVVNGIEDAGYKSVLWNGSGFASGMYMYRIDVVGLSRPNAIFTQIRKLLILK